MFRYEARPMTAGDIRSAIGLQHLCFPPPFPAEQLFRAEHLERHLDIFPEGQFVVTARNDALLGNPKKQSVLGSASTLILSEETWLAHDDWETTCGGFTFKRHDPHGTTLFGADISVHPGHRGRGVGRMLYEARFDLVRRLGLKRFGTACRIPGFGEWSAANPGYRQDDYCRLVEEGEISDRTLTPLLRYGLQLTGVVENHMHDEESGDAAAILEWVP